MFSTTILPDYRKLKHYFPNITDLQITQLEERGGVESHFEYQSEESYKRIALGVKLACEKFNITQHYLEVLFLLLLKYEQIIERYEAYCLNYEDELKAKEIASFLLAYKEVVTPHTFSLSIKPSNGKTASIKNEVIRNWMAEQFYQLFEKKKFPPEIFGEKILFDLFGNDFKSDAPISIERLRETSKRSPRLPSVRFNRLFTELCLFIQPYLDEHTILARHTGVKLSDAQASFFFELLETLEFVSLEKVAVPKDYVHAIFDNYFK